MWPQANTETGVEAANLIKVMGKIIKADGPNSTSIQYERNEGAFVDV